MGFTTLIGLAYAIILGAAAIAFRRGNKTIGIGLLAVIVFSIVFLGYMWIQSPM